jgi:sortase A
MKPDDSSSSGGTDATDQQRDAAAAIARQKVLDSFQGRPENYTEVAEPVTSQVDVGATDNNSAADTPTSAQQAQNMDDYHAAWQDYYRRYYEAYYTNAVRTVAASQAKQTASQKTTAPSATDEEAERAAAMGSLKEKIKHHAHTHAKKIRRSRHFIPIVAGVVVVLAFLFLQYNRVIIASVNAYIMPSRVNTTITEIDPGTVVGPDPVLIIPKINVRVPIVFNVALTHEAQMEGMERGVIHFAIPGANSLPGQVGNTVLSGHSSGDVFDRGDYKFIFAQLERLEAGDTIFVDYQSVRYTYVMTRSEVVLPTNVGALIYDTDGQPKLTLITCVPVGTARYRLLVTATQISPSPENARPAPPETIPSDEDVLMPSMSSSFFQRLWSFLTGRGWPSN